MNAPTLGTKATAIKWTAIAALCGLLLSCADGGSGTDVANVDAGGSSAGGGALSGGGEGGAGGGNGGAGGQHSAPYELAAFPAHMEAIPAQRCVFLVELGADVVGDDGSAVTISAEAGEGALVTVVGQELGADSVAEVEVTPLESSLETTLTVTIRGRRGGLERELTATIDVITWQDEMLPTAEYMRDLFVPFLEANRPELGITSNTSWAPTIVQPSNLVVGHYLFFSDTWEMGVVWHVTIPPNDWTEIYLRRRLSETTPSAGFRIASVQAGEEPAPVAPPTEVDR